MKEIQDFFKMFGARSAIEILEFLGDHGEAHHKEMLEFVYINTLNKRLRKYVASGNYDASSVNSTQMSTKPAAPVMLYMHRASFCLRVRG